MNIIKNKIELTTRRTTLIPFSAKYITPKYVSWFNDKEVCLFNRHGEEIYTEDKAKNYFKEAEKSKTDFVYAIILKKISEHIGNSSISAYSKKNRSAEINIILGEKKYWGLGLGYEIFSELVRHCFEDLGLHRVKIGFFQENLAMRKICKKLDFKLEGVFIDATFKGKKYHNIEQWARISEI